jgi:hypothetical protein
MEWKACTKGKKYVERPDLACWLELDLEKRTLATHRAAKTFTISDTRLTHIGKDGLDYTGNRDHVTADVILVFPWLRGGIGFSFIPFL